MNLFEHSQQVRHSRTLNLLLFWAFVFLLNTGPHWEIYSTTRELFETVGLITGLQFFVAWVLMRFLVPKFLNQDKKLLFVLLTAALILLTSELNILVRFYYLETTYADSYVRFLSLYGDMPINQRMMSLWTLKYIFFTKLPLYLYPAVILLAHDAHHKQQLLLKLSEQKRKAELDALKNQLNPHFIFNTLNNLYALTLKKSDQAPEVIEKLSDILDYMLYRCDEQYVSLNNEIVVLKNYITLEQLRYGKRLSVTFEHEVPSDVRVAPLLLLSLLENACKHSTSQELNKAYIQLRLAVQGEWIKFSIHNTKPLAVDEVSCELEPIGLENMRKQLNLLYPHCHQLEIINSEQAYEVRLELQVK